MSRSFFCVIVGGDYMATDEKRWPSDNDIDKLLLSGEIPGDIKYFWGLTDSDLPAGDQSWRVPATSAFAFDRTAEEGIGDTYSEQANDYSGAELIVEKSEGIPIDGNNNHGFPSLVVIGQTDVEGKFLTYPANPKNLCYVKGFSEENQAKLQKRNLINEIKGFELDKRWVKARVIEYPIEIRRNGDVSEEMRYAVSVDFSHTPKKQRPIIDSALETMCRLYKPAKSASNGFHV